MNQRRHFLVALCRHAGAGLALTPLLAACARAGDGWPEGMEPIAWDRDACTRCKMVISDRRFAVETRSGPNHELHKFDDIGCALAWLHEHGADAGASVSADVRIWVAAVTSRPEAPVWLDARTAYYLTRSSPMGYDFGAAALPEGGALGFDDMRAHVLARGR